MCGICGVYARDISRVTGEREIEAMASTIVHRGPDDQGVFVDRNIGLGSRRLSIIDVDGGHMPLHNEDRTCTIVHNGEVYNFPELRSASISAGHAFSTNSDTETIVHLYEDYGIDCLKYLNGMFAFAIFDSRDRSLLLARDRLGIKPLYYADTGTHLVFGSEIKTVLAHPSVKRDLDPVSIDEYFQKRHIPGTRTIYRGINKLAPGHFLRHQDAKTIIEPYWSLSYEKTGPQDEEEAEQELSIRLRKAVEMQMISDVPLGTMLSGGIDSSIIVGLMSEISSQRVRTFSIGFEENSYNELKHARVVADRFNTEHHELVVKPDVVDLTHRVLTHFDEPFGDSSSIPTYLVSELARKHVKVALSGTGADELFAGYERYWSPGLTGIYRHIPRPVRSVIRSGLRALPPGHQKRGFIHRATQFTQAAELDLFERHAQLQASFTILERSSLYNEAFLQTLGQEPLHDSLPAAREPTDLDSLLSLDTRTTLVDDYLVKDDRASMAVSLELRVPFLDHTLVEFAASLPANLKLKGFKTKYLLKCMGRELLPASILKRPKHGFELPVASWLAQDLRGLVEDTVLSPSSSISNYVSNTAIKGIVEAHNSGRENNARMIWSLLAFELWSRSSK